MITAEKQNPLLSVNATSSHIWHVQTVAGGPWRSLWFFSLLLLFFLQHEGWVESFCTQLHCSKFVGWFVSCCIDPPCHLELVYWHIESAPLNLLPFNYGIHMMSELQRSVTVDYARLLPPPSLLSPLLALHHLPCACHRTLTFPLDRWHYGKHAISTHVILLLTRSLLFFFRTWEVLVQQMDFQFASCGHFFFPLFIDNEKNHPE